MTIIGYYACVLGFPSIFRKPSCHLLSNSRPYHDTRRAGAVLLTTTNRQRGTAAVEFRHPLVCCVRAGWVGLARWLSSCALTPFAALQVFGLTKAEEIMKELEAVGGPPHVPPPLHTDPSVQPPPPLPPEAAPPESGGEDAGGEAPAAEAAGAVDLTAEGQPLQAAAAGKEEPARGRPLPAEEAPREAPTGAEGGGGGSGAAGDDAADTAVAAEPEPSAVSGGSGQPAAVREAPAGPEGAREAADGGDVDGESRSRAPPGTTIALGKHAVFLGKVMHVLGDHGKQAYAYTCIYMFHVA